MNERLSPKQRWGTCCPSDPECEHSFLDIDELLAWMESPITDEQAARFDAPETILGGDKQ